MLLKSTRCSMQGKTKKKKKTMNLAVWQLQGVSKEGKTDQRMAPRSPGLRSSE